MCGPGQTCNTDECGPPITYACFNAGTVTEGGSCITKADCAVGLTCLRYKLAHACRTLCAADADCPAGGYKCNEGFTCGTNTATAGKYCTKSCSDPSTVAGSAGCGQGFRCNFYCDATTHMSTPPSCDFEAGALKSGTCTDDEDCAAGYYCLSASLDGGTKVCTQGCRTNADCATGTCSGTLYCDTTPTQYHYCKVGG
jgi:hypothetical protein